MQTRKVGDVVWCAFAERRDVTEICPVCYGKKQVTLILGNDDSVILPCDYCGKGYGYPMGTVKEIRYVKGAEQRAISKVDVQTDSGGERVQYQSEHYILYPDRIFDTKQEALDCCEKIAEALNEEQKKSAEHIKADVKKGYSWNAGYHLREAKRHEADAARHRERAVLCKAKSKEAKDNG